jgi:hypothetical protein
MEVACIFVPARGGNTDKDAEHVSAYKAALEEQTAVATGWAVMAPAQLGPSPRGLLNAFHDDFVSVIQNHRDRDANDCITLNREELVVIGSEADIAEAFAQQPVCRYTFAAPMGKNLCLTYSRVSPDPTHLASRLSYFTSSILNGPSTLALSTIGRAMKTPTVLHIYPAQWTFGGKLIGTRNTGSQISDRAKEYFSAPQ